MADKKKHLILVTLMVGGILCIVVSLIVPVVAPVLGPVGGVLISTSLGIYQGDIQPVNNNNNNNPRANNTQKAHSQNINIAHDSPPRVNILFLYDQHREYNALHLDHPSNIIRPRRPINIA